MVARPISLPFTGRVDSPKGERGGACRAWAAPPVRRSAASTLPMKGRENTSSEPPHGH